MRTLFILLSILYALAGCATVPGEENNHAGLWVALGLAVVAGAVVASQSDSGQQCNTVIGVTPGGSDHVTSCR